MWNAASTYPTLCVSVHNICYSILFYANIHCKIGIVFRHVYPTFAKHNSHSFKWKAVCRKKEKKRTKNTSNNEQRQDKHTILASTKTTNLKYICIRPLFYISTTNFNLCIALEFSLFSYNNIRYRPYTTPSTHHIDERYVLYVHVWWFGEWYETKRKSQSKVYSKKRTRESTAYIKKERKR